MRYPDCYSCSLCESIILITTICYDGYFNHVFLGQNQILVGPDCSRVIDDTLWLLALIAADTGL